MQTERPNTVSGLIAKRAELIKLQSQLEAEVHKITCDLDHLDAAIALFDPANTPRAVARYAVKHRAKKGALKRFVLGFLRDASGPVTSKDITTAWIAARGLRADDATYVILRKRIGACLIALRAAGLVADIPQSGEYKGWRLVALKGVDERAASWGLRRP
jgi:hypothetical protein